jgi:hypothetical protein
MSLNEIYFRNSNFVLSSWIKSLIANNNWFPFCKGRKDEENMLFISSIESEDNEEISLKTNSSEKFWI